MTRLRWLIRLLGVALFAVILIIVDVPRILTYLAQADLWPIMWSNLLVFPYIAVKAWRWQVLLRSVGIRVGLVEAARLYAVGLAAGFITPGQTGEAVRAVYLGGAGHSLGRALVTVVLDRLFDLLVVGGLALWGIFVYGQVPQGQTAIIVLSLVGIVLLFVFFAWRGWQQPLGRLIVRVVPARFVRGRDPAQALGGLVLPPATLGAALAITLLSFVITYYRLYLLFVALDLHVPLVYFLASTSIAGIAAILPVTIGGVGTRDAAFIVLFSITGESQEMAVALSTLILLQQVVHWTVGFAAWVWKPTTT